MNYSDYPVEDMTAQVLGKWKHAKLYVPDSPPRDLETYAVDEGAATGIDIAKLTSFGALVLDD